MIRTVPAAAFRAAALRLLCALLALLFTLSLVGQEESPGTAGLPFLDTVDVDVVNVEVFVTDRSGRRVDDLTRDDFEVRVDGEPVEISNFFLARDSRSVPAPLPIPEGETVATLPEAEEPGPTAAGEPAVERRPLFLVVYVDNVNLTPANRKRVLDDVREMVAERTAAGDPVMIVSYDGGLHVEQPFTREPEALAQAISRIERQATRRQIADRELRTALHRIEDARARNNPVDVDSEIARYRAERTVEALGAYKSLQAVVRSLAGLPGRRAVLYVSEGIPRTPGAELVAIAQGGAPTLDQADGDLHRHYKRIAHEANAHEITLYTLDARGSMESFFTSAEARLPIALGPTPMLEFARDTNLQEPLLDMALYTGGQAVINTTNFSGAFDRLVEDFQSFYSLGFLSPYGGDGEYHRIDVRVKRPGLRVRHRAGYLAKGAAERVADRTTSFLLQRWESNPMGVSLGFGEPKKQRRHWRVPLVVRIPADALVLLPQGDQAVGRVQLFVASQDDEGGLSEVTQMPREVTVSLDQLEEAKRSGQEAGDIGFAVEVALRSGPANLVVAVLDEIGGTESYVFQKLLVGEAD